MNTALSKQESKSLSIQQATRLIGVECRKTFTDAIHEFNQYVDDTGEGSKSGGKSYMHFTKQLYRCLGLSTSEADAILEGHSLRDQLGSHLLHVIALAEKEAASIIYRGMSVKRSRRAIKDDLKELFTQYGKLTNRINNNINGADNE